MGALRRIVVTASSLLTTGVLAGLGWQRVQAKRVSVAEGRVRLNEALPVHSKWWWDLAKNPGDLLYVAIGDSAAQGIGASAPRNSYVGVIADHLRAVTGRTVRVVNLSVSGATVALAVADQLPRFATLQPDIVTVSIGANDIAAFDRDRFRAGLRAVFAAVPDHAIVADLPYFFLPWNERLVAEGNRILREEASARGLEVVPLHETMRREGLRGIFTQFAEDLFHPNDHGYRVWASAFLPAVSARARLLFPRSGEVTEVQAETTRQTQAEPQPESLSA